MTQRGISPPTKAKAAAEKALRLDDSLAEAHTSLTAVMIEYVFDWAGSEREYMLTISMASFWSGKGVSMSPGPSSSARPN